jgi:hypothetical protein
MKRCQIAGFHRVNVAATISFCIGVIKKVEDFV